MTKKQILLYLAIGSLIGGLIVYLFMPREGKVSIIQNKIDSLHSVIKWKDIKESHYRDSVRAKDAVIEAYHQKAKKAENMVSLAEASTEQWRQRYYVLKKLTPQTARDSLRDLVLAGNACDSLVNKLEDLSDKRAKQVVAIGNELTATQAKVKALDTLNITLLSENRDLKQLDSLHIKNEKVLKKKARRSFLKGGVIGVAIGVVLALLL